MIIYIGADHRGFELKEYLKNFLKTNAYEVVDVGNDHYDENDDYPDFAEAVGQKVSVDFDNSRGVVICGSGVGVDVVVNKFRNIRSVLAFSSDQAFDSRNDDNNNVIALPADFLDQEKAKKILQTWLQTPFSKEERHKRRLEKIAQLELKICQPLQKEEN